MFGKEATRAGILALSIIAANGCSPKDVSPSRTTSASSGAPSESSQASLVYHGDLNDHNGAPLEGKPLISDKSFEVFTNSLMATDNPLLTKVVADIRRLHLESNNPAELSEFVDEISSPLPIVITQSDASAALSSGKYEEINSFVVSAPTGKKPWPFVGKTKWAIELALPQNVQRDIPLAGAFYLAKETLSFEISQRIEKDAKKVIPASVQLLNLDGSDITDLKKRGRAEYSFIYYQDSADRNLSTLIDGLPALMLAAPIIDLIQSGKLPTSTSSLSNFYKAAQFLSDHPDYLDAIKKFNTRWISVDTLLGPDYITGSLLSSDLLKIVTEFYPQMQ